MGADDRRHDGFAIEGDPDRTNGRRDFALAADASDDAALYKQRTVLNCRTAIARNYSLAFEQDGLSGSRPQRQRHSECEHAEQRD